MTAERFEILRTPSLWDSLDPTFRKLYQENGLDQLLDPNPQDAAEEIFRRIRVSKEGTVNLLYSLSMFSGKTRAAIRLAKIAGSYGIPIVAIQPSNGIRFGESQESEIMTHQLQNPESYPSKKIGTNLFSALEVAKELNDQNTYKKVLIIDEGMFYFDHQDNPEEAEVLVEGMRDLGIHIVITGITRTYQATPFIVMDHLVKAAPNRQGWNAIEMSTQCAFGPERAKGTARYVVQNGNTRLATLSDPFYQPGSANSYVQVCVDKHPSFAK